MFSPYCIKENILKIIYDKLFMIKRRIKCHRVKKVRITSCRQNTSLINLQNNITFHWSMTKNFRLHIQVVNIYWISVYFIKVNSLIELKNESR